MKNSSNSIRSKARKKWVKSSLKCKKSQIMFKPCSEEVKLESRKCKKKKRQRKIIPARKTTRRKKRKLFHAKLRFKNC